MFFHSVGDIQQACVTGKLVAGGCALFNGGSLLKLNPKAGSASSLKEEDKVELNGDVEDHDNDEDDDNDNDPRLDAYGGLNFIPDFKILDGLQALKSQVDVGLGIYIQETVAHHDAVSALIILCNNEPQLFDLGFSFGGLCDVAAGDIVKGGLFAVISSVVSRLSFSRPPEKQLLTTHINQPANLSSTSKGIDLFYSNENASGASNNNNSNNTQELRQRKIPSTTVSASSSSNSLSSSVSSSSLSSSSSSVHHSVSGLGPQGLLGRKWKH